VYILFENIYKLLRLFMAMFGLDDIYFLRNIKQRRKEEKNNVIDIITNIKGNVDEAWFIYLPASVYDLKYLREKSIPKNHPFVMYRVPMDVISLNFDITDKIFNRILDHSIEMINKYNIKTINTLGQSLGNCLSLKLANDYNSKKVVSIVPGGDLSDMVGGSLYIEKLFGKNKYDVITAKNKLKRFDQTKNLENLPDDITVYISYFDKIMPYIGGKNLVEKMKKNNKKPKVITSYLKGHVLTIFFINPY